MPNLPSATLKRTRAHTISLPPISSYQRSTLSHPLDINAAKQRTADWKPSLPFHNIKNNLNHSNDDDKDSKMAYMAMYSAFGPYSTHPLLLSSALSLPTSEVSTAASRKNPSIRVEKTKKVDRHSGVSVQGLREEVQVSTQVEKRMPWPYSLPRALQPKVGTTYEAVHGGGQTGRVGVWQKVFYGVLEPGE